MELEPLDRPVELEPVEPLDRPTEPEPDELEPVERPVELDPVERPVEPEPDERPVELDPVERSVDLEPDERPVELEPVERPVELEPVERCVPELLVSLERVPDEERVDDPVDREPTLERVPDERVDDPSVLLVVVLPDPIVVLELFGRVVLPTEERVVRVGNSPDLPATVVVLPEPITVRVPRSLKPVAEDPARPDLFPDTPSLPPRETPSVRFVRALRAMVAPRAPTFPLANETPPP